MFLKLINFLLGDVGRFLRDLYVANSLWINAIVILYAIVIFWNHGNLGKLYKMIEGLVLELSKNEGKESTIEKTLGLLSNAWQERFSGKNLIIPSKNDFWYERIDAGKALELFMVKESFIKMVLHQKTGNPPASAFSREEYLVWRDYLQNMRLGLRTNLKNPEEEIQKIKEKSSQKRNNKLKQKRK